MQVTKEKDKIKINQYKFKKKLTNTQKDKIKINQYKLKKKNTDQHTHIPSQLGSQPDS
jgi:hypothetical protein